MPFSSRKGRNATSSVNRAYIPPSSRLNPVGRFRSGPSHDEQKLPPTSNPFDTLFEERTGDREDEPLPHDGKHQIDDLTQEMESFAINTLANNPKSTLQTTRNEPVPAQRERREEVGTSEHGWKQASRKHTRDSSNATHESRPLVQAARTGTHVSNWRSGNTAPNSSTWHAPRRTGTATYRTGRGTRRGVGKIFFGIPLSELVVGVIIFHKETRECYYENAEGDVFKSNDGQLHFRKGRFSVIEAVHAFTMTTSPMFTYRGMGLEKKNEEVKKEHVGVRPLHVSPDRYVRQNKYSPLEVESMSDEFEQLHEKTILRFTERSTITFDTQVRIVGRLTSESIARLRTLRAQFGC